MTSDATITAEMVLKMGVTLQCVSDKKHALHALLSPEMSRQ